MKINPTKCNIIQVAVSILALFCLSLLSTTGLAQSAALPSGATVSAFGRTSLVQDDGSFDIFGIPANTGNFRVRLITPDGMTAQSDVLTPFANGVTFVPFLTFGSLSPVPVSLAVSAAINTLTTVGQMVQLGVTGTFQDGMQQVLTTDPLTYYISSNPSIATVSQSGLVSVKSIPSDLSMLIITAMNEGTTSTSTFKFLVSPPVVAITSPSEGTQYVPGQAIYLQASITSAINISKIDFTVDGAIANTQTSAPYTTVLMLPTGDHTLGAHAYDSAGQRGDATPVHIKIIGDPFTMITGIVVDANGKAIAGARVRVGSLTAITDSNGRFTINSVPTTQTAITIIGTYTDGSGNTLLGSTNGTLVRGGITDIGTLILTQRGPWPKFHADVKNTGIGIGNGAAGILKWRFLTGENTTRSSSSPAIGTDGTVYIGAGDSYVYALHGQSGTQKWKVKTGNYIQTSPALGADGTVYVGSFDNYVYALDGQTGTQRWQFLTGNPVQSSPAIGLDGTVYIGSDDTYVYALNGQSGTLKWKFKTNGPVSSSPAIGADGTIYIGSYDSYVYAIDGQTGVQKWKFSTGSIVYSSPAIGVDGAVYVGSYNGYLYALDGQSGTPKWQFKTGASIYSSPAIGADGTIYIGSYDSYVYAIDGQMGAQKWKFNTGSIVYSSPAIGADGTIYAGGRNGYVFAINGQRGTQKWQFLTGSTIYSSPAIGTDGTVYIRSSDGYVYAIQSQTNPLLCQLINPLEGATFVAGEAIYARAAVNSQFDISHVDFIADSVVVATMTGIQPDPVAPYVATLSLSVGSHTLGASAYNMGGQQGNAVAVHITVTPDPLTTIIGRIVDANHAALTGAVASTLGISAITDSSGRFTLLGVPTIQRILSVIGRYTPSGGLPLYGSSSPTTLARSGITDVGDIVIGNKIWPKFHADAKNTGRGLGRGATGILKWRCSIGSADSSPAIGADGTVYVGSGDGYIYAFDGQNGTQKWKFQAVGPVNSSPAIGADGTVYVGSGDGYIYALDGQSGTQKWKSLTGGYVRSSPALGADGTVYVGSYDGYIYALDGQSGMQKWNFKASSYNYIDSSPAIGVDGTVYIGSSDHYIYALDGQSGMQKWRFQTGNMVYSSPALGADGTVYIGSRDGYVYALDGQNGTQKWKFATGRSVSSSPAIGVDGTIYVGVESYTFGDMQYVYALDGQSGMQKWKFATGYSIFSSPAIGADGTVYIGSGDYCIYALDGQSGTQKWKFATGDAVQSSPAIGSDGTVYIGSYDGFLYAIK